MSEELSDWLSAHALAIVEVVQKRAPNLLLEEQEVSRFVTLLGEGHTQSSSSQLSMIQSWSYETIGADALLANDWITALRMIKEIAANWLARDYPSETAFVAWRDLDRVVTLALVETARLAADSGYSTMLAYMEELKRELAALEQSKSSFVTVAAHELRTPLTILEGYANMVRGKIPQEDKQLHLLLDGMGNGIRRLKEIISDIIDVTMIDSQALSITFQPLHLDKIVRMAADNLADAFQARNVKLEVFTMPVEQQVYGDPSRLFQAVSRLLVNGLKYTPDGGQVQVTGHMTRMNESNDEIDGFVDIRVRDSGIGIDPAEIESIFEKFGGTLESRHHSSGRTKFKGGGPGLGLPIVRGIVEAHGGRVWAESSGLDEINCPGSVFHIELPVRVRPPS